MGVIPRPGEQLTGGGYGSHMGKFGKALKILGAGMLGQKLAPHIVNPLINGGVTWAIDGKSKSLGGWLYDVTHKDQAMNDPYATCSHQDGDDEYAVVRCLEQANKTPSPEAKPSLNLIVDDDGRVRAKDYSMTGTGFRMDTGPTLRC